jgi:hypothetical protein
MGHGRDIVVFIFGLLIGAPIGIVLTCILAMGNCTRRDGTDGA